MVKGECNRFFKSENEKREAINEWKWHHTWHIRSLTIDVSHEPTQLFSQLFTFISKRKRKELFFSSSQSKIFKELLFGRIYFIELFFEMSVSALITEVIIVLVLCRNVFLHLSCWCRLLLEWMWLCVAFLEKNTLSLSDSLIWYL